MESLSFVGWSMYMAAIRVSNWLLALAFALWAGAGFAAYPERPIRLVVGAAPGGAIDVVGRMLGQKLGEILGQTIVIDNRGGANGIIGTDLVAKAAPDGYTLLITSASHSINPGVYRKLPYDTLGGSSFSGV
jgi:tripartite-type tricarboxylate transporter receptor subunit TctC